MKCCEKCKWKFSGCHRGCIEWEKEKQEEKKEYERLKEKFEPSKPDGREYKWTL